jgi:C4-dicarboxylate transporter/malic acid transport protein
MRPFKHYNYSLLKVIQNFTPNWFAVNMGVGVTAICINILLAKFAMNNAIAIILWLFNILLFTIFISLFTAKLILFPKSFLNMLKHSAQPMFLGCMPMGLATIINGCIIFGENIFGNYIISIAINLWYLDVVLSLFCIIVIPYFMFMYHDHKLETMTGLWLLPFVACEVAAASGNMLLPHLYDLFLQQIIFISSLCLWTLSVSFAFHILVILLYRLTIHKIPSSDLSATIWLPVGPMATGSFTMFLFANTSKYFHHFGELEFNQLVSWCNIIAIILWVIASWWVIIATLITVYYLFQRLLKFNLGFWGYTFPLGVYILSTNQFYIKSHLLIFGYEAYILSIMLFCICVSLLYKTLKGFYHGSLIIDTNIQK